MVRLGAVTVTAALATVKSSVMLPVYWGSLSGMAMVTVYSPALMGAVPSSVL